MLSLYRTHVESRVGSTAKSWFASSELVTRKLFPPTQPGVSDVVCGTILYPRSALSSEKSCEAVVPFYTIIDRVSFCGFIYRMSLSGLLDIRSFVTESALTTNRKKVFLPDVSRSGYFVVDRGIVGGDQALGPAQSLDDLDLLPQGVPPADAAGPSSSHESSWERVDVPLATGTGTADTSGFDPLAPPGSPVASQASLGEPNGDETAVTTGSQGSGSESSSSSSSSSSSDDEATARAPPPVLQPPVPWRAGCVVWRHTKTRKLHLVGLADSRLGASFTCGREITSAYAPLVSTVVLQSDRCSQCDKGRHIRSVAQLNLEIKRQRVDRA